MAGGGAEPAAHAQVTARVGRDGGRDGGGGRAVLQTLGSIFDVVLYVIFSVTLLGLGRYTKSCISTPT